MMNKIERMIAAITEAAELLTQLCRKELGVEHQPELNMTPAEAEEPKEEEKPAPRKRTSRAKKKDVEAPKEEIEEPNIADELGLNGDNKEEEKAELTEEETFEEMKVQIRLYLKLNVKETPDGKTKLSAFVAKQYKCAKLGDLVHDQRLSLLAFLVKKNEEGNVGGK